MTYNIFIKKLTKIGIFLSFLFLFSGTFAATIESTSIGGNWDNSATWVGGIIPSENDIVEVYGNVTTSGKVVSGLTIHSGATLTNQNLNSTFSVTGDVNNYGTIKLLSTARKWQPYCCYITVSYNMNLNVKGLFTNFGSVTGGKVTLSDTFTNLGTLETPIYTTGTGSIYIIGDIQGTLNHSSEGILNLGGFVSNLNILGDTKLEGTLDIGTLNIGEYNLDINTYNIVKISKLVGTGKIHDSRNIISELTILELATSSGAVISFDTLNTSRISGIFTGVEEIVMDGGSITAQEIDIQKLELNGTISTSGFILQGDLENNGTLKNFRSNGAITIHGNIVNNGIYNGYDVKAEYNRALGWVYTYYNINLTIKGNLENNGEISNASRVYLSWSPIEDYNDYILFITGQDEINITNTTRYLISNDILNESSEIFWKVKGDGPISDSEYSDEKCINVVNCGVIILPTPTNLTQSFIAPLTEVSQPIEVGQSIGKFQSGSGVILSAQIDSNTPTDYNLLVELFRTGEIFPFTSYLTAFTSNETELTVPFLGAGNYYWKATVLDNNNNKSNPIAFENDNFLETDFKIFEGFEPYPYGYRFHNANFDKTELTGGINTYFTLSYPFIYSEIRPGTKWDIFENAFDNNGFISEKQKIKAFKNSGLVNADIIAGGSCYGMSLSAIMKKEYPNYLSTYYSRFYREIQEENIWDGISPPSYSGTGSDAYWDKYDEVDMKSILAMQLSQKGKINREAEKNGINNIYDIISELKNNPNGNYIINFYGEYPSGDPFGHAVVPYKVEEVEGVTKIYVWDNNIQYPFRTIQQKNYKSYDQYFEIDSTGNWVNRNYFLKKFTKITLINVEDIYANNTQTIPVGFHITDIVYTLSGSSDMIVTDSFGRVSGFQNGEILDEIPGVEVFIPLNAKIDEETTENTWKQIYLPEKQDLTVQILGNTDEEYDLFIAGGDYYTEIVGVDTFDGQIDSFIPTKESIEIDFDDTKIGEYDISVDNFEDADTESIYLSNIGISTSPQKYSIDWGKVQVNDNESIKYEVDKNKDGIYDVTSYFSAIPNPHDNVGSISGYVTSNPSNAGYKVCLDENNNGRCEESREEFIVTDETGYYNFSNLEKGEYTLLQEKRNNWSIVSPEGGQYEIYVNNGQNYKDLNFVNEKIQGKKNK